MRVSLSDVYTIWLREMKRLMRSKARMIVSLAQPILWLLLFGTAFDSMFGAGMAGGMDGNMTSNLTGGGVPGIEGGLDFKSFFTPGIVAMTVLFGSIFSGIGVIFDREFGFLKEILVAPVSRTSIVMGKALGGSTSAVLSGIVILAMSTVIGAKFTPDINVALAAVVAIVAIVLISWGFVNMGIAFASKIQNMEGFQMVMNLLVMPMFFLSGAFYPLSSMPGWLQAATYVDPLFYGVDLLRHAFNGAAAAELSMALDFAVLVGFTVVTTLIGVYLFRKAD